MEPAPSDEPETPRIRWGRSIIGGVVLGLIGVAIGKLLYP
jgi:hypothetical protein